MRFSKRDFLIMLLAIGIMGIGIALFKLSLMGNDPSTALVIAIADNVRIDFSIILIIVNTLYFVLEIIFGRRYVGIGTFVNWFGVGIIASFFIKGVTAIIGTDFTLLQRVLIMGIGVLVLSLSCSMYQTADMGISPYDSLSIMMKDRLPIPYFWCRIITDVLCTVGAFALGGIIGVGTLICALGLGPFISFFDRHVSRRLCGKA